MEKIKSTYLILSASDKDSCKKQHSFKYMQTEYRLTHKYQRNQRDVYSNKYFTFP